MNNLLIFSFPLFFIPVDTRYAALNLIVIGDILERASHLDSVFVKQFRSYLNLLARSNIMLADEWIERDFDEDPAGNGVSTSSPEYYTWSAQEEAWEQRLIAAGFGNDVASFELLQRSRQIRHRTIVQRIASIPNKGLNESANNLLSWFAAESSSTMEGAAGALDADGLTNAWVGYSNAKEQRRTRNEACTEARENALRALVESMQAEITSANAAAATDTSVGSTVGAIPAVLNGTPRLVSIAVQILSEKPTLMVGDTVLMLQGRYEPAVLVGTVTGVITDIPSGLMNIIVDRTTLQAIPDKTGLVRGVGARHERVGMLKSMLQEAITLVYTVFEPSAQVRRADPRSRATPSFLSNPHATGIYTSARMSKGFAFSRSHRKLMPILSKIQHLDSRLEEVGVEVSLLDIVSCGLQDIETVDAAGFNTRNAGLSVNAASGRSPIAELDLPFPLFLIAMQDRYGIDQRVIQIWLTWCYYWSVSFCLPLPPYLSPPPALTLALTLALSLTLSHPP